MNVFTYVRDRRDAQSSCMHMFSTSQGRSVLSRRRYTPTYMRTRAEWNRIYVLGCEYPNPLAQPFWQSQARCLFVICGSGGTHSGRDARFGVI